MPHPKRVGSLPKVLWDSMNNNNQILHGDQTRWGEIPTGLTMNADTICLRFPAVLHIYTQTV